MPYRVMYGFAIVITILSVIVGAILSVDSNVIGLNAQTVGWLGVIAAILGALNGLLPRVTAPPNDTRIGKD